MLQDSRLEPSLAAAEKEFRAELIDNAGSADAEYRLGIICSRREAFQGALRHYKRALDRAT